MIFIVSSKLYEQWFRPTLKFCRFTPYGYKLFFEFVSSFGLSVKIMGGFPFHSFNCWQPMLQELGKQNPQLMRLIQEHQADFLRLINEPVEGGEGYAHSSTDSLIILHFVLIFVHSLVSATYWASLQQQCHRLYK